jgi:hypothetical protein
MDIEKIKEEKKKIKRAVKEKFIGSILAAFGLVVGLAWNDAIKSSIEYIFPTTGAGLIPKFIYAVILTICIAIFAYYISKWFSSDEEKV